MNKIKFTNWLISFLRTSNWKKAADDWKMEADIVSTNDQELATIFRRIALDYTQLYERVLFLLNEEAKLLPPKQIMKNYNEDKFMIEKKQDDTLDENQEADELWNYICERMNWKNG